MFLCVYFCGFLVSFDRSEELSCKNSAVLQERQLCAIRPRVLFYGQLYSHVRMWAS